MAEFDRLVDASAGSAALPEDGKGGGGIPVQIGVANNQAGDASLSKREDLHSILVAENTNAINPSEDAPSRLPEPSYDMPNASNAREGGSPIRVYAAMVLCAVIGSIFYILILLGEIVMLSVIAAAGMVICILCLCCCLHTRSGSDHLVPTRIPTTTPQQQLQQEPTTTTSYSDPSGSMARNA